jgi:hypothetical protein
VKVLTRSLARCLLVSLVLLGIGCGEGTPPTSSPESLQQEMKRLNEAREREHRNK